MNLLKKMFYRIPTQVVSTFMMFAVAYVFIRGIMAIIHELPSAMTLEIVLGIGIFLGVMDSLFETPKNEKKNNNKG